MRFLPLLYLLYLLLMPMSNTISPTVSLVSKAHTYRTKITILWFIYVFIPTLDHWMLFLIFKDASYSPNITLQTSIIYTAYSLCFGCQAMECWWKKMHKSVTITDSFYGVSSWSCLSSHQPFYSSQMSQSYSLTFFSPWNIQ